MNISAGRGIRRHGCEVFCVMLETIPKSGIIQGDLVPPAVIEELEKRYAMRWPLRELPKSLGGLLEVLE